ncbi:MAG: hypothetical protein GY792_19830, partial [Gammaproteobacteria bacterium]|nr:hypothetical protein [Gammaproteobacteria bacterium]
MADSEIIIAAAEALYAESGKIPTVQAVRDKMISDDMGRGSFSDISPVLKEWRAERQAAKVAQGDIPGQVRDALERAAGVLWGSFQAEMDERMNAVRQQADAQTQDAGDERDQAIAEVNRLEQDLKTEQRSSAQMQTELQTAQARLADTRQDNARLSERTDQQQARMKQQSVELECVRADLQTAWADAQKQAQRLEEISQKLAEEKGTRHSVEVEAERLRTNLAEERLAREDISQQLVEEKSTRHNAEANAERLRTDFEGERSARAKSETNAHTLGLENAKLSERVAIFEQQAKAA